MLIIAADSDPVREHVERRPGGPCVLVAEHYFGIDPITDGLYSSPTGRGSAEEFHGDVGKPVYLAVTAVEQIDEGFVGQLTDRLLAGMRRDGIGNTRVLDQRGTAQPGNSWRRYESGAAIAEAINVAGDRDLGLNRSSSGARKSAARVGCTLN